MTPQILFGISVLFGFVCWGTVAAQYLWPWLRKRPRVEALRPLLLFHSFRYVGLSFLIPGVVSPDLPAIFAGPAAYGDLFTAILALLAFVTIRNSLGIALAWIGNVLGTIDLLYAFYNGNRTPLGVNPGLQGAAFYIPTVLVPLLLVTHVLMFRLLLQRDAAHK
jgi:hypothetical protein